MATYTAINVNFFDFLVSKISTGVIAGTVSRDGAGVQRTVLVYKNGDTDLYASGMSNSSTGIFSIPINAGSNDKFRVICVGGDGENDEVFGKVAAILD